MSFLIFSDNPILLTIVCVVIAFLLGSIPFSIIIGKLFYRRDIRQSGSGNIGATNALRTLGAKAGILVLLLDVLKGYTAVMSARMLMGNLNESQVINLAIHLAALAVISGHVFSIFLRFKGGKGVATAAGIFIALMPVQFLLILVLFIFIVAITRYVSLGSLLCVFALFLIELFTQIFVEFNNLPRLLLLFTVTIIISIRHKENIRRLLSGTENKISFRKKVQE